MENKQGKKKSIFWIVLVVILTLPTMAVCAFPYLPLKEGSLLYAVGSGVYSLFEKYLNFFPKGTLSIYGLAPLAAFALLVLITTFLGAGPLSFLLKALAFYSLYLVFAYAQGAEGFEIVKVLPNYYHWIALGVFFVSCLILLCSCIARNKRKKVNAEPKDESPVKEQKQEQVQEAIEPEAKEKISLEETEEPEQSEPSIEPEPSKPKSTMPYKEALKSLSAVCVPEFEKFPNSLSASILKPHAGVTIYDVVEREAEIKKAAQEQKRLEEERLRKLEEERQKRKALEEERARQEAEAEKKRLESLFKPRTLLRRLSEDAEAEKDFSAYSSVDYGISVKKAETAEAPKPYQIQPEYQGQTSVQKPVQPSYQGSVQFQAPPSQMINPYAVQFQSPAEPVGQPVQSAQYVQPTQAAQPAQSVQPVQSAQYVQPTQATQSTQLVQPAQPTQPIQPTQMGTQPTQPVQNAQFEVPQEEGEPRKSVFELEDSALKQEELPQTPRASFKEEEERAQSEMEEQQRRRAEERQAPQVQPQVKPEAQVAPANAPTNVEEPEEEDDIEEFEKSKAAFASASETDKKKSNMPDIDYVSGVAGLKSNRDNGSHLLDADKFVYHYPPESLLKHYEVSAPVYDDVENDPNGRIIVETFKDFNIGMQVLHIQHGPTFTLYELALQRGVKVSRVTNYAEDIAMNLAVASVRILAPIPGKTAIGIEVPNKKRDTIGFDVMMEALKAKPYKIPMVLGKNITGDSIVIDLTKTPHLLVAGTTGSGKSVCINGLICSVLFTKSPKEVRMILVDPKMVELSVYNGIPHLLTPVITEPKKALKAMNFVVDEMTRRMALFSSVGAKKIEEYNEKIVEKKLARVKLPYIMVIVDEFADLMLTVGKELEASIKRITALARFCGIHLVLATQRPSVDVITGIIKSNIPTQIAFAVSNSQNSRIIIDSNGAEKLLGRGDMLYNSAESRTPSRIQGAYIDSEIEDVVNFVKTQGEPDYIDESYFEDDEDEEEEEEESASSASEDLFSKAWKIVSDKGEASASYLQRRLNIGYNRAANLIEQMEDAGYIGPARGSKPREILRFYGSD